MPRSSAPLTIPYRDLLGILAPAARAEFEALPDGYRRTAILEILMYEVRLKCPRRNQSITELFARERRRREHQMSWMGSARERRRREHQMNWMGSASAGALRQT